MTRALVIGAGATGARTARQLCRPGTDDEVIVCDPDRGRTDMVVASIGGCARAGHWNPAAPGGGLDGVDVVVVAVPQGHRPFVEVALAHGVASVSTASTLAEARPLLSLDAEARERGVAVVVGAGFAPGLSCLLARHAATGWAQVAEVHVARSGTGGPACARAHHRTLRGRARDWRDGAWNERPAGSGRELVWFPDPVGGRDCYRGALPDPTLLVPAFPGVERVTARVAATRRDRVTSWMPMLRPPHPEGLLGAVHVEVRGVDGDGRRGSTVLGAVDRPAVAAGTVAAEAARWAADGRLARPGAGGLAELVADPLSFLQALSDLGVRAAAFGDAGPPG